MKKHSLLLLFLSAGIVHNSASARACKSFGDGSKSYATRIITDTAAALAGVAKSEDLTMQIGFAFLPLAHDIAHETTHDFTGYWKWLASNWTSLGIAGLVYTLKQTVCKNWTNQEVLRYILAGIYTQWAAGITVAELGLNQADVL